MRTVKLFIKGVILIGIFYALNSCNVLNKGMSASEYYNHLREDTVICELNTFAVESSFEPVLNTAIKEWEDCPVCKEDPHPFIFEVEEILLEDTLMYIIKTNASPKIAHHYYLGAFRHEGYVFAVVKKNEGKSLFIYDEKNEPTKFYFCDRIHSSKCGLIIKCQNINKNYNITSIECQEGGDY
jgi:hypothetical protein